MWLMIIGQSWPLLDTKKEYSQIVQQKFINTGTASTWRRASVNSWGVSQGPPSFILSLVDRRYSTTA